MEEQGEDKDEQEESRPGGEDDGEEHLDQVLLDREDVSFVIDEADKVNDADDAVGPPFLSVIISDKVSALWPGIGGPCEFRVGKDDGSDKEGTPGQVVGGDKGKAGDGREEDDDFRKEDEEMACSMLQVAVLGVGVEEEEEDKGGDNKAEEEVEEEDDEEEVSLWRTRGGSGE